MTIAEGGAAGPGPSKTIQIANESLQFRTETVREPVTGLEIAQVAGFGPGQSASVLQLLDGGGMEDIRPEDHVGLDKSNRFIVVETDRLYILRIDGERYEWPARIISGHAIRKLGNVAEDREIFLRHNEPPEIPVHNDTLIDLNRPGIEAFVSRVKTWKLNVQGVILDLHAPTIVVRQALVDAGFNPDQGWHIFLKVQGQPKRPVTLTDTVDLREPGIEKLRLTPKEVNNGEAATPPRRQFKLLPVDEEHLHRLGLRWETVIVVNRRWLLIHAYPVPPGYTASTTTLAMEIPPPYPGAQIYGFYAYPPLNLANRREIQSTQLRGTVDGLEFHGWSRNRGATPWNPSQDNVVTQLALADAAIAKEVGE